MRRTERARARAYARAGAVRARNVVDGLDELPVTTPLERQLVVAIRALAASVERLADVSEAQEPVE